MVEGYEDGTGFLVQVDRARLIGGWAADETGERVKFARFHRNRSLQEFVKPGQRTQMESE